MLAYLLPSKVATLTQSNSLSAYFRICISVAQLVRNIGIAVYAGIAVFAGYSSIRSPTTFNVVTRKSPLVLFIEHQSIDGLASYGEWK